MEGLIKHFLGPYIQKFEVEEAKVAPVITSIANAIDWPALWAFLQPAIKDKTKLQAAVTELKTLVPEVEAIFKL
jgi:hypothetical protein